MIDRVPNIVRFIKSLFMVLSSVAIIFLILIDEYFITKQFKQFFLFGVMMFHMIVIMNSEVVKEGLGAGIELFLSIAKVKELNGKYKTFFEMYPDFNIKYAFTDDNYRLKKISIENKINEEMHTIEDQMQKDAVLFLLKIKPEVVFDKDLK